MANGIAEKLANIPRVITYSLIAIVITLPIVFSLAPPPLESSDFVVDAFNKVETLQSGDLVIVAIDMPPAASDEMNTWRVVMAHIFSKPGVKCVFVSVNQEAAVLATEFFITSLVTGIPEIADKVYGEDWIELGFLPGDASTVALLAKSFRSVTEVDRFGNSFDDLPMIGPGNDLNHDNFTMLVHVAWTFAWVDQWRWAYEPYMYSLTVTEMAGFASLPGTIAGGQHDSGVPGIIGGSMYEQLWGKPGTVSAASICIFSANTLLLIFVIIGNVAYLMMRSKGEKK
jgi:hypothetical protein